MNKETKEKKKDKTSEDIKRPNTLQERQQVVNLQNKMVNK